MSEHTIRYIQSENLQIAASCEAQSGKITPVYLPSSVLLYAQTGTLHVRIDGMTHSITKGGFAVLRKYTEAELFKSWKESEGMAKTYGFGLTNAFIEKVIGRMKLPARIEQMPHKLVTVPATQALQKLMRDIIAHVDRNKEMDGSLAEEKTLEALRALVSSRPDLHSMLYEFSLNERADMEKLMLHNFLLRIPLKTLAEQSGRSLSTFHREFKAIFKDTPHRWILKQRLYFAQNLMKTQQLKASKVYMESGFEDLAHFSRAFKKQFHSTPTQYYNAHCR